MGSDYGWSQRDWGAAKRLRAMAVGDDNEVVRRWECALQTTGYYGCLAVHELEGKWNYHAPKAEGTHYAADEPDTLRAEIIRWVGPDDPSLKELVRTVRGGEPKLVPPWLKSLGFADEVVRRAEAWAAKQPNGVHP